MNSGFSRTELTVGYVEVSVLLYKEACDVRLYHAVSLVSTQADTKHFLPLFLA